MPARAGMVSHLDFNLVARVAQHQVSILLNLFSKGATDMATISQLSSYSQTALASYAINLTPGGDNTSKYVDSNVRMSESQSTKFNATWDVIQQATSINGFSAVLLKNRTTNEKVLAIAGTDPASPADLITDLLNIALYGTVLGMPQYLSLESFYAELVTSGKLGFWVND